MVIKILGILGFFCKDLVNSKFICEVVYLYGECEFLEVDFNILFYDGDFED